MDRVRQELRRPAVWLIPLIVLGIQLVGSIGPRHRAGDALHWAPLNCFGYLLLVAGPVALLLRTVYSYAVLLTVLAITVVYKSAGFGYGPIFVSLVVAYLTAAAVGSRWWTYPLPVLGWVAVVCLVPLITHVSRILTKLAARDRTQLVVMAYESGLVRPGWRS